MNIFDLEQARLRANKTCGVNFKTEISFGDHKYYDIVCYITITYDEQPMFALKTLYEYSNSDFSRKEIDFYSSFIEFYIDCNRERTI